MIPFTDWGFWAFIMTAVVGCFNYFAHQKITGNDLKHVEIDLKTIHANLGEQDVKLDKLTESMSYIKGRLETESKVMEILEKVLIKSKREVLK